MLPTIEKGYSTFWSSEKFIHLPTVSRKWWIVKVHNKLCFLWNLKRETGKCKFHNAKIHLVQQERLGIATWKIRFAWKFYVIRYWTSFDHFSHRWLVYTNKTQTVDHTSCRNQTSHKNHGILLLYFKPVQKWMIWLIYQQVSWQEDEILTFLF